MDTVNFHVDIFNQSNIEHILINEEPWFKAKQVAEVLGYTNSNKTIKDHVDNEDRKSLHDLKQGGNESLPPLDNEQGQQTMINESGVYSLVLRSRKPQARAFKRWVTSQVLPAIRQNGKYETSKKLAIQAEVIARQKKLLQIKDKELEFKQKEYAMLEEGHEQLANEFHKCRSTLANTTLNLMKKSGQIKVITVDDDSDNEDWGDGVPGFR